MSGKEKGLSIEEPDKFYKFSFYFRDKVCLKNLFFGLFCSHTKNSLTRGSEKFLSSREISLEKAEQGPTFQG
jgi:hypothetical protein